MYCQSCGAQIPDSAKFCTECGASVDDVVQPIKPQYSSTTRVQYTGNSVRNDSKIKTAKLVIGILCIVISLFVLFQSCAVGVGNAFLENNEASGGAGIIVAFLLLAGGIVMIATRNAGRKGGSIACFIMFGIGALMGSALAGSFSDLRIWSGLCLILAIVNLVWYLKSKKE